MMPSGFRGALSFGVVALLALVACAPGGTRPPQPPNPGGSPAAAAPPPPANAGGGPASTAPPPRPDAGGNIAAATGSLPGLDGAGGAVAPPLSPPVALKVGSRELIGEAGIFAAIEKGYFREEGLDVDLETSRTTPEQTAPLATGELAYASFGVDPSIFNAVTRGIAIKIVGYNAIINPRNDSGGWMVRQDLIDSGRYQEPKDLKGLNVFLTTPGGTSQVLAERMLAKGGLTLNDVELNYLPFQDFPAGLASKVVDSGFLPEPFVSVALRQRTAQLVMPTGQIYFPGTPVMVLGMSPVFAQQQPDAARRFLVGYLRGQRDYYRTFVKQEGGRAEWDAILAKYTPIKDPETFTRMTTHDVDVNGVMDVAVLNQLQDYFLRYGTQQQRVDLGQMIDPSYADYALGRLGRVAP